MAVRLAVLDLDRRIAVVRAADDGVGSFPHALRGVLAAMVAVPRWHVLVAFDKGGSGPDDPRVAAVLGQARRWGAECGCEVTVASVRTAREIVGTAVT